MRSIVRGSILAAAIVGTAIGVAAEPKATGFHVSVKSGRLTVEANNARLADVLKSIEEKAAVGFVLPDGLDSTVTESFADVTLDDGLRRLLRGYSLVLIYDPVPASLDRSALSAVWIAGGAGTGRSASAADVPGRDARSLEARPSTSVVDGPGRDARSLEARHSTSVVAQNPELRKALASNSAARTRRFVEDLVREQGAEAAVRLLQEASRDVDPSVRRGTIRGLRTLSLHHPAVRSAADRAIEEASARSQ